MKRWQVVAGIALLAVVFVAGNALRAKRAQEAPAKVASPAPVAEAVVEERVEARTPAAIATPAMPAPRVVVSFRMDPAVMRGHYLGDRWVSPETFAFAQPGKEYVVQAKVQTLEPDGTRTDLGGAWTTPDPGMIAIARGADGVVTITVRQAGEGAIVATAAGVEKRMRVRATQHPDAMEVAITQ